MKRTSIQKQAVVGCENLCMKDWGTGGLEGGHERLLEWLLKVVVTALRVGMSDTPKGPIQGQVLWGQRWDSGRDE